MKRLHLLAERRLRDVLQIRIERQLYGRAGLRRRYDSLASERNGTAELVGFQGDAARAAAQHVVERVLHPVQTIFVGTDETQHRRGQRTARVDPQSRVLFL